MWCKDILGQSIWNEDPDLKVFCTFGKSFAYNEAQTSIYLRVRVYGMCLAWKWQKKRLKFVEKSTFKN